MIFAHVTTSSVAMEPCTTLEDEIKQYNTKQYNITLLPSVNTIARGMFPCLPSTLITHSLQSLKKIYSVITTTTHRHPGKRSFINKKHAKTRSMRQIIFYRTSLCILTVCLCENACFLFGFGFGFLLSTCARKVQFFFFF